MGFIIITIFIWVLYTFIMKKKKKESFRFYKALLPMVIFSAIIVADLGINYAASAIPNINDGIGIHTFWAYWIIGDDSWSIPLFKSYFDKGSIVSIVLLLVYSILRVVED